MEDKKNKTKIVEEQHDEQTAHTEEVKQSKPEQKNQDVLSSDENDKEMRKQRQAKDQAKAQVQAPKGFTEEQVLELSQHLVTSDIVFSVIEKAPEDNTIKLMNEQLFAYVQEFGEEKYSLEQLQEVQNYILERAVEGYNMRKGEENGDDDDDDDPELSQLKQMSEQGMPPAIELPEGFTQDDAILLSSELADQNIIRTMLSGQGSEEELEQLLNAKIDTYMESQEDCQYTKEQLVQVQQYVIARASAAIIKAQRGGKKGPRKGKASKELEQQAAAMQAQQNAITKKIPMEKLIDLAPHLANKQIIDAIMKSMPVPKVQRLMRGKINDYIKQQGGEEKMEYSKQDLIDAQQFIIQRAISQMSRVQMENQMDEQSNLTVEERRKLMEEEMNEEPQMPPEGFVISEIQDLMKHLVDREIIEDFKNEAMEKARAACKNKIEAYVEANGEEKYSVKKLKIAQRYIVNQILDSDPVYKRKMRERRLIKSKEEREKELKEQQESDSQCANVTIIIFVVLALCIFAYKFYSKYYMDQLESDIAKINTRGGARNHRH